MSEYSSSEGANADVWGSKPPHDAMQPPSEDLAGGDLTAVERAGIDVKIEEWRHRRSQQSSAFSIATALAALLFLAAIVFGGWAMAIAATRVVDWHVLLLAAVFVLPPTILMVALIRAVYAKPNADPEVSTIPQFEILRQFVAAIRDGWRS